MCLRQMETGSTRSEEHTSELQSHSFISYAVFFFNDTATTEIYTLSLHDALPISVMLTIIVEEVAVLTVPNVFTPNGDGINDLFTITSKGIKSAAVVVFNRWGQVVAKWDPLSASWDGTDNGKPVSDGVYYYVISATDFNDKPMEEKGYV